MDFKIRDLRTVTQGRKQLVREREAYSQLVQQGPSNRKACRIVGINEKAGRRWRNGRSADRRQKAAPPIHAMMPPSCPSRYLGECSRCLATVAVRFGR
jgi:transposase, IS30 family